MVTDTNHHHNKEPRVINTSHLFQPGKILVTLDGGAGSSGKGKLGAFIGGHADNWQFCCNTFSANAAHWVVLDDGTKYLYQTLNSVAHLKNYQKMYVCGGSVLELPAVLREIKEHNLTPDRLGIHPIAAVTQQKDIDYERGTCNFDGEPFEKMVQSDCMKLGSTLHGVGAARARRILRRADVLIARDVPELKPFLCWTEHEVMNRLERGESGLMEIAQGYQLSYLSQFYPKCTSRNCSVSAGLDDCCLPPSVVGDVVINFRTFPIRVNSNKYVHAETGKLLNAIDMAQLRESGQADLIKVLKGDSGGCYADQRELTWDEVTAASGIQKIDPTKSIREITSLTKLERRVYTFSKQNLLEAVRFNRGSGKTHVSINFINYVDAAMEGVRGDGEALTEQSRRWLEENIITPLESIDGVRLTFIGTGAKTDDMIVV